MKDNKTFPPQNLPPPVYSGIIKIMGLDLYVYVLSNGEIVMEPNDFQKLLDAWANEKGLKMTKEEFENNLDVDYIEVDQKDMDLMLPNWLDQFQHKVTNAFTWDNRATRHEATSVSDRKSTRLNSSH